MEIYKRRLSWSLYFNYFIHGFALIILAQNMTSLATSWQTTIAVVSYVMSGVGIGRLIAYPLTGLLADRLSRKLFVYLGMVGYLIFALGMVLTPNLVIAYGLAIIAGMSNSALDTGTYTTLVELNDGNGAGTVLIKAFMSAGEFILPLIVVALHDHRWWYGWSFVLMALLLVINLVNLIPLHFPKVQAVTDTETTSVQPVLTSNRRGIVTALLLVYGFTSMAVMIWFTQWITLFAQQSLHFSTGLAHLLLSLYSIGSISGVLVLYWLLKRQVAEKLLLVILNGGALVSLLMVSWGQLPVVVAIGSILFGFCASGGVMQTGLTLFMKLYPRHRGLVTGLFYFFGSLASLLVPLLSGWLSQTSIRSAFSADVLVAVLGVGLTLVTFLLLRKED
ncbi:MFS transporter [Fructilactobacillus cliffordii]|uniref:MFS transporter n=1 Tax=Fructilactobacillus cliffordii TaxID=2940299 RepID=A0A9Q8ZT39_9LACO|nr:MFS transporter [Fructilactobacillus cliffordii]USS89144.1 MFS transporter [Fructilactobacillus cliffordii]